MSWINEYDAALGHDLHSEVRPPAQYIFLLYLKYNFGHK